MMREDELTPRQLVELYYRAVYSAEYRSEAEAYRYLVLMSEMAETWHHSQPLDHYQEKMVEIIMLNHKPNHS